MNTFTFAPWVGKYYNERRLGKRLLVLGESHYCASAEHVRSSLTREVIEDLWDPHSPHEAYKNTYTKCERALAGRALTLSEREELWQSLIFYNYVQVALSEARVAPTQDDFARSAEAFASLLESYQPERIIVWGYRLWESLPSWGHSLEDLVVAGKHYNRWAYPLAGGGTVHLLRMMHPSAAFSPEEWHQVISVFIQSNE